MAQATGATYGKNPGTGDADQLRDYVRLLVGDVDCSNAFLLDSEIDFFVNRDGSPQLAAASAAEAIWAICVRKVDVSTGGISKALSGLADRYAALAKKLKAEANECVAPIATGLSESIKRSDAQDSDLVQPSFFRGMHDNPRADQDGETIEELFQP